MMGKRKRGAGGLVWLLLGCCLLFSGLCTACGRKSAETVLKSGQSISPDLHWIRRRETAYAKEFSIDDYQEGYVLLSVADGSRFLLVPEGMEVPGELEGAIIVLHQPMEGMYLAASAVMDMFGVLDGVDSLRFSGTKAEGWHISRAREAMEEGSLLYAGKYNMPDYERMVTEKCSLAIENTMINHTPEVRERLEALGIPVLVDYSSYEEHPLGRTEWVKFYGALLGKDDLAEAVFEGQERALTEASQGEKTGKRVAFFYLTSNGAVNVRKSTDYLPKMIALAGGEYVFSSLGDQENRSSSISMQVEEFYRGARDADVLIYNSAVDGELESIEDLLDKCGVLKDAKAVLSGNVWCATEDLYQKSMAIGTMIHDLHQILSDPDCGDEQVEYFFRLKPLS